MAIKTQVQRLLDESRFMPRLMKFAKGIKVDDTPRDTELFNARFSDARFAEQMLAGVASLYQSEALDVIRNAYLLTDNPRDDVSYFRAFEHWGRGLLLKRCDGETITKWWDKPMQKHRFADDTREASPLSPACTGKGAARDCGCKMTGRLRVILPDLIEAAGVPYGYVEIQHTAWRDDASISACLADIEKRFALPYQIPLSRVPLMLFRQPVPAIAANGTKKTENVIRVSVDIEKFNELLRTQGLSSLRVAAAPVVIRDEDALTGDEQAIVEELDSKDAPDMSEIDTRYLALERLNADKDYRALASANLKELDRLAIMYLGDITMLDFLRESLNFSSWAEFFMQHRTLDAAKRVIASAIAEEQLGVRVYGLETSIKEGKTSYAIPFGFARALLFSRDAFRSAGFKIGKTSKLFQKEGRHSFAEALKTESVGMLIQAASSDDNKTRYFLVDSITRL